MILVQKKPGWGSREEKERDMIMEKLEDEGCMGNITRSDIVGASWEASMTAL